MKWFLHEFHPFADGACGGKWIMQIIGSSGAVNVCHVFRMSVYFILIYVARVGGTVVCKTLQNHAKPSDWPAVVWLVWVLGDCHLIQLSCVAMVLKALMKAILVLVGVHVSLAVSGKSKRIAFADDISTSQHESQWFRATDCLAELNSWCQEWEGIRMWHCLDGFSYSRRVASSFEYFGYRACNFDIRCSKEQDILSRRGFFMALNQCMEFPGMECMGGYFSIILDILDALRLNFTKMNISWRFSLGFNGFHMVSCLVLIIPEVTHECRWMFFLQHFQCQTKVFPDLSWPFWLSLPRLMEHSLFMLAPPCSLLVPISSSVHRRNAACRTLCKFLQRFHMFSYVFHVFPNLRYVMACFIWRSVPPHSSITHIQDLVLKCFEWFWCVLSCVEACWCKRHQMYGATWRTKKCECPTWLRRMPRCWFSWPSCGVQQHGL